MKLRELFGRAGLDCPEYAENIEVKNIVTDSRRAERDSLFICIRGERTDGHEYIDRAIENGAIVIIAEQVRDACVGGAAAFIMLDNTRKVAALLYNAYYGRPVDKLKIIGVTGTNGKTTACHLLYDIFEKAGVRSGLIGTVCRTSTDGRSLSPFKEDGSDSMTTPPPDELYRELAEMVKDGVEYVFMEVSSHSLVQKRVEAIEFECAVFTNLTEEHLDFHGTMEEYYKAKSRLFEKSRRAVINIGGEYGKRLALECPCPFFTYSVKEGELCALEKEGNDSIGDFCALDVKSRGNEGMSYTLKAPTAELRIETPMLGDIAVENTLAVSAVALSCGIPPTTLARTLATARGAKGRMEKISLSTGATVVIDYAHTPDALEKLLRVQRKIKGPQSRLILVFGCGGERERQKRRIMGAIATKYADLTVVTSDNCRGEKKEQIIADILKGIDKEKPYCVIADRRRAIEYAIGTARMGDLVVLAGKGHESYEIDAHGKRPFDERQIVKEAEERTLGRK